MVEYYFVVVTLVVLVLNCMEHSMEQGKSVLDQEQMKEALMTVVVVVAAAAAA